jgi:MoxR-like ATPase
MDKHVIRPPSETRYAAELESLKKSDRGKKPEGWALSPRAVETFILGAEKEGISPKYLGNRSLVQVAIATLASDRALILVGEPGTAKSWLSEHLAAAVSGTSELLIQGTSGVTEDQVKYSWNYAMLLRDGPSPQALKPSPILRGMQEGRLVRFEEVTRCASEVQDALISILSEKNISIPELGNVVTARKGFNVIATANTRDRGVNEMSSALRRRFNFVTVPVVGDIETEIKIVDKRTRELMADYRIESDVPRDLVGLLVTIFAELRAGEAVDEKGKRTKVKTPSTVLSTAEAISAMFQSAILAEHFGSARVEPVHVARSLVGAVCKEDERDVHALVEYLDIVARSRGDGLWKHFHEKAREVVREATNRK